MIWTPIFAALLFGEYHKHSMITDSQLFHCHSLNSVKLFTCIVRRYTRVLQIHGKLFSKIRHLCYAPRWSELQYKFTVNDWGNIYHIFIGVVKREERKWETTEAVETCACGNAVLTTTRVTSGSHSSIITLLLFLKSVVLSFELYAHWLSNIQPNH